MLALQSLVTAGAAEGSQRHAEISGSLLTAREPQPRSHAAKRASFGNWQRPRAVGRVRACQRAQPFGFGSWGHCPCGAHADSPYGLCRKCAPRMLRRRRSGQMNLARRMAVHIARSGSRFIRLAAPLLTRKRLAPRTGAGPSIGRTRPGDHNHPSTPRH